MSPKPNRRGADKLQQAILRGQLCLVLHGAGSFCKSASLLDSIANGSREVAMGGTGFSARLSTTVSMNRTDHHSVRMNLCRLRESR